jgi:CBS-domain-containing membrane protein
MTMLTLTSLSARSLQIPGTDPWYAQPGDPALSVMTDFLERSSVTVPAAAGIDAALEHMKHTGVRSAFAVDEAQRLVLGLITAYDIMGEKPMRSIRSMDVTRAQLQVKDVMTALADLRVVDIRQIEAGTIGDLARLFAESQLTHIPVVETDGRGGQRLRGMLSAARVKRVLAEH